jgi:hypothetical protein
MCADQETKYFKKKKTFLSFYLHTEKNRKGIEVGHRQISQRQVVTDRQAKEKSQRV